MGESATFNGLPQCSIPLFYVIQSDPKDIRFANYDLLLEYVKSRLHYEDVAAAENRLGDKAIHDGCFSLDGLAEGKEEEEMAEERRQTLKDFFHSSKGPLVRK
jgi:hypothetical protein